MMKTYQVPLFVTHSRRQAEQALDILRPYVEDDTSEVVLLIDDSPKDGTFIVAAEGETMSRELVALFTAQNMALEVVSRSGRGLLARS